MAKIFTLLFIFLLTFRSPGQYLPGARQNALANSAVTEPVDIFCLFHNPSLILALPQQAGIYYSPAPFGMEQLRTIAAAGNYNTGPYSFGAGITSYGFELYRQTAIIAAAAAPFLNEHQIGFAVNAYNLSIRNYGSAWCLYYNAGFLLRPFTNTSLGLSIQNFSRSTIGSSNTPLPTLLSAGVLYNMHEFNFSFSFEKETDRLMTVKGGVSFSPIQGFDLLAGYNSQPAELCAGISAAVSFAGFIYALRCHQTLGYTHQAGVILKY